MSTEIGKILGLFMLTAGAVSITQNVQHKVCTLMVFEAPNKVQKHVKGAANKAKARILLARRHFEICSQAWGGGEGVISRCAGLGHISICLGPAPGGLRLLFLHLIRSLETNKGLNLS